MAAGADSKHLIEEEDVEFEENILRNSYSIKAWLRYLDHKPLSKKAARYVIYERALRELPGSYKLWFKYLRERVKAVRELSPADPARLEVVSCFERALIFMHKMPRIWTDYLEFLTGLGLITRTRRAFDNCLRALPVTQHARIWPLFIKFVKAHDIPETAVRVFRRWLKLDFNAAAEMFVQYLISVDRLDEAAQILVEIVNKRDFVSTTGKTNHQLWVELCDLVAKNPHKIHSLKIDPVVRAGLRRFTDMMGTLWTALADYYIRRGTFEKARDIFEEAVQTVTTVRDFAHVFEAYSGFEESSIAAEMARIEEEGLDASIELDMRVARFELLIERRPLLLSSVLLRQNPHNVEEWHKRVALHGGKLPQMIKTYTEAVLTVDPAKAVGKLHTLWLDFARLYEENNEIDQARAVLERAVLVPFKAVDDLAATWCYYAEMETRQKDAAQQGFSKALAVLKRATTPKNISASQTPDGRAPAQARVHRNLQLWSLYVDLEESVGNFETTRSVYTRMLELRVCNPQTVINFATFLWDEKRFEEAFSVYERGVALFKWPVVYEIWSVYLVKFMQRFGDKKVERARELFEQAVDGCSPKFVKPLYELYASFELEHGNPRHAMAVLERAARNVPKEEQLEMWQLYINKAGAVIGVPQTRSLYEKAIAVLSDRDAIVVSLDFADLERKLGEIDRARAIYAHASQFSDPRTADKFWKTWHDFEVKHGNEDTFREMLRLKRAVAATFNVGVNFAAVLGDSDKGKAAKAAAAAAVQPNDMANLEAEVEGARRKHNQQFVKSGGEAIATVSKNRDEISLDDDDDDEDNSAAPAAASDGDGAADGQASANLGAKARFAAKK